MSPDGAGRPPRPRRTIAIASGIIVVSVALVVAWTATRPVERTSMVESEPSAAAPLQPAVVPPSTPAAVSTPTPSSPSASTTPRGTVTSPEAPSGAAVPDRLFAATSPWNTPIPTGAALDPDSAAISKAVLTDPDLVVNMNVYAFGIPFYTATSTTPRVVLGGRGGTGAKIPLDPSWRPNEGADHKMNVIDPATDSVYELQGYDPAARSAYWMVRRDLTTGLGDGSPSDDRRGPTGSGMTQAGGIIRIDELRSGRIDHALSFITSEPLAGRFRYPATSTDGTSDAAVGIEEGMRIQLDPSLDLDSLHLGKAERAIARALQVYGAYCVDRGLGNNQAMGFYAEKPSAATGDPYPSLGVSGDWAQLKGIPRSAYRVLAASVTRG